MTAGYRYGAPRYLVLGPVGTGKSTLVRSLAASVGAEDAGGGPRIPYPCTWHALEHGELIDVPGALVQSPDLAWDVDGWRALLRALRSSREMRPIDGVVLTLSAIDLLAWERRSTEELRAMGQGLADRLREASEALGLSLPVYVLLTRADELPGFGAIQHMVPAGRRQDMIGWSTPHARDAAFDGEWVREALQSVVGRLTVLTAGILAVEDDTGTAFAVVRAPEEIRHLIPAARLILTPVFGAGADPRPCVLRGIYLSGRIEDPAADSAPVDFVRELFVDKVVPERGLATVLPSRATQRRRALRWRKLALVLLVFVGLPGLWAAQVQVRRQVAPLAAMLDSLDRAAAVYETGNAYQQQAAAFRLMTQFETVDLRRLTSVFLPSSWFGGVEARLMDRVTAGGGDVVVPTLRRGLIEWADTLADPAWAVTIGGRVPLPDATSGRAGEYDGRIQEYEALIRYLHEVKAFAENAERFNRIVLEGPDADPNTVSDFLRWYFEEEPPSDVSGLLLRAVSAGEPLSPQDLPRVEAATANAAGVLVERYYERMVSALRLLEEGWVGAANSAFVAADLRSLYEAVRETERMRLEADSAWWDPVAPIPRGLRLQLDSIPTSALLDRGRFVSEFNQRFDQIRARLLREIAADMDRVSPGFGGDRGQLSALRVALEELLNASFMAPPDDVRPEERPAFGGTPTWNVVPLRDAVEYFEEYRSFTDARLGDVPAPLRPVLTGVAQRGLEGRVRSTITRAMSYEVGPVGREPDLERRLASFETAGALFVEMLRLDERTGGTPAGRAVAEVVILEVFDMLDALDDLLAEERLYDPVNGNLAVWTGEGPASFAGFGVSDVAGLETHLTQRRRRVAELAELASPVLTYLSLPPVADALRVFEAANLLPRGEALVGRWQGIVRTTEEYERGVPGNSLAVLERFVREDMSISSVSQCAQVTRMSPVDASDYFEAIRARLSDLLVRQCEVLQRTSG